MSTETTLEETCTYAIKRAEGADPNDGRCLVENCSKTQAVQVAHIFDRNNGNEQYTMDSLEWSWRMVRGTLNLDTRRNIFFLGASLFELFKNKRWALLPEREVVMSYIDEQLEFPRFRAHFRDAEGDTFKYTFLPLRDMEDICLTRQCDQGVDVHHYPFDSFPIIESHIHPKFVILHLGDAISGLSLELKDQLMARYPWLDDVVGLRLIWETHLPGDAANDALYRYRYYKGFGNLSPSLGSEINSTPLRRLQPTSASASSPLPYYTFTSSSGSDKSSTQAEILSESRNSNHTKRSASWDDDESHRSKKRKILTESAVEALEEMEDADSESCDGRVVRWIKDCQPATKSSLHSVDTFVSKPPLRRSARLKAKLQKKAL